MEDYKTHPFYTHQPVLTEVIKATKGDILECGCGVGSTNLIKDLIKGTQRNLVSLESNEEWLNKFKDLESDTHKLYKINATNDDTIENASIWVDFIKTIDTGNFEVIFIDSSPWLSRKVVYDYFKSKPNVIVIHDFDYFPNNGIIGKTISKDITNGKEKITMDLEDPSMDYMLFYPPDEFFPGFTGPPTFIATKKDYLFDYEMDLKKYY
jgi:hypothetical protein